MTFDLLSFVVGLALGLVMSALFAFADRNR